MSTKREETKKRLLTRRAAVFLGLPIPEWAERTWGTRPRSMDYLKGAEAKYYFPPDYVPTAPEITYIRKLCRDSNIPVPAVAAPKKYTIKKRFGSHLIRHIRDK